MTAAEARLDLHMARCVDLRITQAEMAKLKAELRRTTEERDILKKAAAYFAKQSG